jgi:hypothetical protein
MKYHIRQDLIQESVRLYTEEKLTQEVISDQLCVSRPTICLWLKRAGVISIRNGPNRKFTLNESFFESISTHSQAYWLGFLLADGHIVSSNSTLRLELQSQDRHHIVAFLHGIGSNTHVRHSVRYLKGSENHSDWTILCSSKLINSLVDQGWNEFKKQGDCRIVREIPDMFKPSLMRGLFDGDGSFMRERATFVDMHLSIVYWFQEELVRLVSIRRAPISPNPRETSHVVKWSGGERLCQIRDFLYSTPGPFLQRKRDVADNYNVKVVTLEQTAKQSEVLDGMKWCPKCETRKIKDLFSKQSRTKDGLYHMCKTCWNDKRRTRLQSSHNTPDFRRPVR